MPEMRDACVQTCGFSPCFLEGTVHTSTIRIFGCLWPFVSQHFPPDVPPDLCVFLLNYQQAPRAKSQKKKCTRPTTCGFISEMRTCIVHMSKIADLWINTCRQKKKRKSARTHTSRISGYLIKGATSFSSPRKRIICWLRPSGICRSPTV